MTDQNQNYNNAKLARNARNKLEKKRNSTSLKVGKMYVTVSDNRYGNLLYKTEEMFHLGEERAIGSNQPFLVVQYVKFPKSHRFRAGAQVLVGEIMGWIGVHRASAYAIDFVPEFEFLEVTPENAHLFLQESKKP